jgi:hypothetical protein
MYSEEGDSVWSQKGATLSDKSARNEFGLTQQEIIDAIKRGKLQYRTNYIYGNPYLRLVRSEIEALVDEKYGSDYLKKKKVKKELAQVNKALKTLKAQVVSLEQRRVELLEILGEWTLSSSSVRLVRAASHIASVEAAIEKELLWETGWVGDPQLPISNYNYSALRDHLKKKGVTCLRPLSPTGLKSRIAASRIRKAKPTADKWRQQRLALSCNMQLLFTNPPSTCPTRHVPHRTSSGHTNIPLWAAAQQGGGAVPCALLEVCARPYADCTADMRRPGSPMNILRRESVG